MAKSFSSVNQAEKAGVKNANLYWASTAKNNTGSSYTSVNQAEKAGVKNANLKYNAAYRITVPQTPSANLNASKFAVKKNGLPSADTSAFGQLANDRLRTGKSLVPDYTISAEDKKEDNIGFFKRLWNTAKGGGKGSAKGYVSAMTTLADLMRNASAYQITPQQVAVQTLTGDNSKASAIENVANANKGVMFNAESDKKMSDLYSTANKLAAESAKDIENAKDGNSKLGNLLVDVGVAGTQLLGDSALNVLAPGASLMGLGLRTFGDSAQEARNEGANQVQQLGYGALKAGIEIGTEKIGDVAKIYGGSGWTDKLAEKLIDRIGNKFGKGAVKLALGMLGEAGEEAISGIADPFAKLVYDNGEKLKSLANDEQRAEFLAELGYEALIGGVLGGLGGAVDLAVNGVSATPQTAEAVNSISPSTYQEILNGTSSFTKAATEILNNPEVLAEYESAYGKVEGQSRTEQTRNLASALYLIQFNGQQTSEAAKTNTVPQNLDGAINPMAQPTAQNGAAHPMAQPEQSMSGIQSYVRGLIMNGEASEILSSPENIAAYEQLTDTVLPRKADGSIDTAKATAEIMKTSRNTFSGESQMAERGMETSVADANNINAETPQNPALAITQNKGSQTDLQNTPTNDTTVVQNPATEQSRQFTEESRPMSWQEAQQQRIDTVLEQSGKGGEVESQHNDTTVKNQAVHPELREKYAAEPDKYNIKTNKSTLEEALAWIEKGADIDGTDNAYTHVKELLTAAKDGKKLPAYAVPLSTMVENELTEAGHADLATDIHSDMGVELTQAGQFIQAVRIMQNSSPQTVLQTIQKAIDKINESISKAYGKNYTWRAELTPAEVETIKNTDFSDKNTYREIYKSIMARLGKEMPSTLGEKAAEVRRINMLLRPRTMIKNIGANIPTVLIRGVDNQIAGAIQDVMVNTGLMDASQQTRTNKTSQTSLGIASEVWSGIKDEASSNNKYKGDYRSALNQERTIFKPHEFKVGNKTFRIGGLVPQAAEYLANKLGADVTMDKASAEYLREATYGLLEAGDVPFVKAAFTRSLAQYCEANGITSVEDITQEAIDFAMADAEYYTYKNANALANAINKLKGHGVGGALVDFIQPFTTTPFNIAKMLVDHNPVVAGIQAGVNFSKGNTNAAIDNVARGVTGGLIMLAGALLRNAGLITGGKDKDEDKAAWDKATGNSPYAYKGRWTYDWAEPAGSLLSFGADIGEAWNNAQTDGDGNNTWDALWNSVWTMGDAFFNMSLMQNVTKLLKGNGSPTETLARDIITSAAGQYSNGFMSSIAAAKDSKNRTTYDADPLKEAFNKWNYALPGQFEIAGIKFGRESLPESVNVKGETETRGDTANRWLDNIINPGTSNYGKMNDADKLLETVYQDTGSKAIFPDRFGSEQTFTDNNGVATKTELTPAEQSLGQKAYSDYYYGVLGKMVESGMLDTFDTKAVERTINNVKKMAKDEALAEVAKAKGLEHSYDNKYATLTSGEKRKGEDYGKLSKDDALSYIMFDSAFSSADNAADYGTMDKLISSFDELSEAVQKEYLLRNPSFETWQKISDAGWTVEDFKNEYKSGIDEMQWMFDTAGQNGLVKLSALVNSNVSELKKRRLAPVVLNSTQNKMYQAMREADPNATMEQFYQLWRSSYNQIDPDGVVLTNSSLSQATLYEALKYWGQKYNWSPNVYDSIWNKMLNEPPKYNCNGLKTKFDMDYESNSKPGSWGAKKNGTSKVTVTYPNGVTKELQYGTDYTIEQGSYGSSIRTSVAPPKGSVLKIDDGNAAPSYHTFASYDKKVQSGKTSLVDSKFTAPPNGSAWKMDTGKALDTNEYNPYEENQLF